MGGWTRRRKLPRSDSRQLDLAAAEDLDRFLSESARAMERYFDEVLPDPAGPSEELAGELAEAMRYATLGGGKRIRPALAFAGAIAVGGKAGDALPAAAAVELIHTYSLIHDDLPCMDDDDLRRGKPSTHIRFGEAVAVLAGDALQALAFELLATGGGPGFTPPNRVACIARLGAASGAGGLVGGQTADLDAETRRATHAELESIHRRKTGALLGASAALGGLTAGADARTVDVLEDFGREIGLVFQIVDDLLDEESTSEYLGKRAGKDRAAGKATYPSLLGVEKARQEAASRTERASKQLAAGLGPQAQSDGLRQLDQLARRILTRRA